jgi:TRAP-type C4-dicarboxylate transport system substrate-binding protein
MHITSIAILLLALLALPVPASAVTFKIATVAPNGTTWMKQMRAAAAAIKERTEGRVTLKLYPGGVMGDERTVLRKMRAGQLHGGAFTASSLAPLYNDIGIYGLPFLFQSYEEVDFVREHLDEQIRAGLEAKGLVALAISETGFAYLMSENSIRSLDDLSHRKVWAIEGDALSETTLEVAGVSPVYLPLSDVYTGLQTGIIDTVATSPMGAIALQWHTKVKYLTDVPLFYLFGVLALDKKAFARISEADRKIVREVVLESVQPLDQTTRHGNENAREALRAQGIEFVTTRSDAELSRWNEIAEETIQRLQAEEGYTPALIDEMLSLLATYRSESSQSGSE